MMTYSGDASTRGTALLQALRPAMPAVIGAAALTFLFAAVIPMSWIASISWNLYLDRLWDLFVPPVGDGARMALAFGMAAAASLIAGFIALLVAKPEDGGARHGTRRSADAHPDDAPRPPILAGRDLPALGLDLMGGSQDFAVPETAGWREEGELILADLAPVETEVVGGEPWLQPAELANVAIPDSSDKSLGAMVARFEAGLTYRREKPATADIDAGDDIDGDSEVDFALEAALSTLQRMNREAVG